MSQEKQPISEETQHLINQPLFEQTLKDINSRLESNDQDHRNLFSKISELDSKVSKVEGKLSIIEKLGYGIFVSMLGIGGILLYQIFKLIAEVSKITNIN